MVLFVADPGVQGVKAGLSAHFIAASACRHPLAARVKTRDDRGDLVPRGVLPGRFEAIPVAVRVTGESPR